jgi:hypothetical protein
MSSAVVCTWICSPATVNVTVTGVESKNRPDISMGGGVGELVSEDVAHPHVHASSAEQDGHSGERRFWPGVLYARR